MKVLTPDAHTAVILLAKPSPYLLATLASTKSPIVPKHLYEGSDILSTITEKARRTYILLE